MLRQRNRNGKRDDAAKHGHVQILDRPEISVKRKYTPVPATTMSNLLRKQPVWLLLAIASGSCAAFNGVFAKLTTTSLTTSWSHAIAQSLSLSPDNKFVEYVIRAAFFGLNLLFNLAMWTLFTAALTRASSTTRVSVINVSANFVTTALLGLVIFGEQLPLMWWAGAGLLAAGSVVIGRREEGEKPGGTVGLERERDHIAGDGGGEGEGLLGEEDELVGRGDAIGMDDELGGRAETRKEAVRKGEDVDAPIR